VAGYLNSGMNVYVADISGATLPQVDFNTTVLSLLYSSDGGVTTQRATRARWPNANPEVDLFPIGWMPPTPSGSTAHYIAPVFNTSSTNVTDVPLPDNYDGMFQDYLWGQGGDCARWFPGDPANGIVPGSYWCQPGGRVADRAYFVRSPVGYVYDGATLPHAPYATTGGVGAIFNAWRNGHWFSKMARVTGVDAASSTISWSYGNFQGSEGEDSSAEVRAARAMRGRAEGRRSVLHLAVASALCMLAGPQRHTRIHASHPRNHASHPQPRFTSAVVH